MFSGGWTTPSGMERYIKAGPRMGAQTLQADLLAAHPPGSGIGSLHAALQRLGFECQESALASEPEICRFRARRSDGQVLTATVELRHDGVLVEALSARMGLSPR